jgi:protein-tyrosine phosphatase
VLIVLHVILPGTLAVTGIGQSFLHMLVHPEEEEKGTIEHKGIQYHALDVRFLLDDYGNPDTLYQMYIDRAIALLNLNLPVVICCAAGQSRSPAIALGVLIKRNRMDFYEAHDYIKTMAPNTLIDMSHIEALKRIFKVGPP